MKKEKIGEVYVVFDHEIAGKLYDYIPVLDGERHDDGIRKINMQNQLGIDIPSDMMSYDAALTVAQNGHLVLIHEKNYLLAFLPPTVTTIQYDFCKNHKRFFSLNNLSINSLYLEDVELREKLLAFHQEEDVRESRKQAYRDLMNEMREKLVASKKR